MDSTLILIPNDIDSLEMRLQKAREFLQENSSERPITAARIYNIPSTLYDAMKRGWEHRQTGGQNRIFQEYHTQALHKFIRSLLASGIYRPTRSYTMPSVALKRRRILTAKRLATLGLQSGGSQVILKGSKASPWLLYALQPSKNTTCVSGSESISRL
jgi:hypothetical protein